MAFVQTIVVMGGATAPASSGIFSFGDKSVIAEISTEPDQPRSGKQIVPNILDQTAGFVDLGVYM